MIILGSREHLCKRDSMAASVQSMDDFDKSARDYLDHQDQIKNLQTLINEATEEMNKKVQQLETLHQENLLKVRTKYRSTKKELEDQLKVILSLRDKSSQNMKRKFQEEEEEEAPECPVCMTEMLPPKMIFQCSEGHLVCSDCKPRLEACATCRDQNGYIGRNRYAENRIRSKRRRPNLNAPTSILDDCVHVEIRFQGAMKIYKRENGFYIVNGEYYNGKPVLTNNQGQKLYIDENGVWCVGNKIGNVTIRSTNPATCPAQSKTWTHWTGTERQPYEVTVICSSHSYGP